MNRNRTLPALLGAVLLLVPSAAGCSREPQRMTIRGTISAKGQLLKSGMIQFVGASGQPAGAVVRPDGTFSVTDVLPGDYRVRVLDDASDMPATAGSRPGPVTPREKSIPVPAKYRDVETSGLSYSITTETTNLDIRLE